MRIGIVNDMPLAVEALRRALAFEPQHQIVWVASNGAEAVTQCAANTPDVVLMDLLMPVMDGVEATRRIMAESPCAIVIVTVDIEQNVHRVFEAMGYGALDAVNTPALGIGNPQTAAAPLLRKIQNVGWLIGQRDNRGKVQVVPPKAGGRASVWWRSAPRLAVRRRSRCCSSNCRPVSMPRWYWCSMSTRFAAGMAEWLASRIEAAGAPGARWRAADTGADPAGGDQQSHPPAAQRFAGVHRRTAFFRLPAVHRRVFRERGELLAWRCRGRAADRHGPRRRPGLKQMRERGFLTIAQDQASCAVYGMPKAAAAIDAAVQILSLEKIAPRLAEVFD